MTEKRFMIEKVLLADIKPVPLQMLPVRVWRKMADFVGLYLLFQRILRLRLWRKMADFVVTMADSVGLYLPFQRILRPRLWRKMADFVRFCHDLSVNSANCASAIMADFVGFCHDFVCHFSALFDRFSLCSLCPLW